MTLYKCDSCKKIFRNYANSGVDGDMNELHKIQNTDDKHICDRCIMEFELENGYTSSHSLASGFVVALLNPENPMSIGGRS